MPVMIVCCDSSSRCTRKVGSSFVKRLSAFEKLACAARSFGATASEMTASGTCIDVIVYVDLAVGERVARVRSRRRKRDDVAGLGLVDVFIVVGVHAHEAPDLDLLLVGRVEDDVALGDRALVDADVRQLAVAAVFELEREADERLRRVGLDDDLRFVVVLVERLVVDLGRVRQVVRRRRRAGAARPCSCRPSRT